MKAITFFPGDTAIINGACVEVSNTVTLKASGDIERIPTPGMTDLPETDSRIPDLFQNRGHRVHTELRKDLRCPCGSAYTRQSTTHLSCSHCKRVWDNKDVPTDPDTVEQVVTNWL